MAFIEGRFSKPGIPETIAYSKLIQLFKGEAEKSALDQRRGGSPRSRKDLIKEGNIALDTLYFQKAQILDPRLQTLEPQIQQIMDGLDTYQPRNIFQAGCVAMQVAWIVKSSTTSDQQRARLYSLSGYSEEEVNNILKNLAFSGVLTGINIGVLAAATGLSVGYGLVHPLGEMSDQNVQVAMALSYGIHYASLVLNMGVQNVRLLESEINNCSNVFSTASYYLTEKFLPTHRRTRALLTGSLPMVPFIAEDIAVLSGVIVAHIAGPYFPDFLRALPVVIPSAVVARNYGLAAVNFLEAGTNEIWFRARGRAAPKTQ